MSSAVTAKDKTEDVARRILILRGEKVLLDADLARLYDVTTKRLNEQVKRNRGRFPPDFIFRLEKHELANLRSQIATSSLADWGGRRYPPFAFTEHVALMAANILNSPRAIEVSIYVVRAFVRLRAAMTMHKDLARKLDALEKKTEELAARHDALASETRSQLAAVIAALRQLMTKPETTRRPIGFVTPR